MAWRTNQIPPSEIKSARRTRRRNSQECNPAARLRRAAGFTAQAQIDTALGAGPDSGEIAAMAHEQQDRNGDREYGHGNVLARKRLRIAQEMRGREGQPADERRERHISSHDQNSREGNRREGTGYGVERQHAAQAGRDAFASSKLEIDRKRMTQDRRQRHQNRQDRPARRR